MVNRKSLRIERIGRIGWIARLKQRWAETSGAESPKLRRKMLHKSMSWNVRSKGESCDRETWSFVQGALLSSFSFFEIVPVLRRRILHCLKPVVSCAGPLGTLWAWGSHANKEVTGMGAWESDLLPPAFVVWVVRSKRTFGNLFCSYCFVFLFWFFLIAAVLHLFFSFDFFCYVLFSDPILFKFVLLLLIFN